MKLVSLIAIGIIGALLVLVIKQYKPEYAIIVSIATAVVLLAYIIGFVSPIVSEIKGIMQDVNVSEKYFIALVKAVGICYLTQFACDICKDAGQNAICLKIELAGRIGICAVALPLYKDLIEIIRAIIGKVT